MGMCKYIVARVNSQGSDHTSDVLLISLTVQTGDKVNVCCVCVLCLRVNAWPYCPLCVNAFVLMFSRAHFYFTILYSTYLYSNCQCQYIIYS